MLVYKKEVTQEGFKPPHLRNFSFHGDNKSIRQTVQTGSQNEPQHTSASQDSFGWKSGNSKNTR